MDLDSELVEEKIRKYRVFKSCSQSTLMGLCEVANHPVSYTHLDVYKRQTNITGIRNVIQTNILYY